MERPFFSLAKRQRLKPIAYVSPNGEVFVKVLPNPEFGMATIWDADILIWAASIINNHRKQGRNDLPRTDLSALRPPENRLPAHGRPSIPVAAGGPGSSPSDLQRLADELCIDIRVHHLPPGTSKWNKIEHRLFSFITMNWRAKPLVSYRVIVDLISATTTDTGLSVSIWPPMLAGSASASTTTRRNSPCKRSAVGGTVSVPGATPTHIT